MKEKLKLVNRLSIILVIISFSLGILLHLVKFMNLICILILLSMFLLYVYLYPKAYFIEPKSSDDYRFPWISIVLSILILIVYTGTCNFDTTVYFMLSLPIILILSIIYIIKLIKIKSINFRRFLSILFCIVIISLSINIPLNKMVPIINSSKEKVEVLSKSYANVQDYEKNFSVYLKIGNSTKKFNITKNKYHNLKEKDYVLIEKNTNLFGMIFYEVY